jgi:hypothetical protein
VFHDEGYTVYEPNRCHLQHQVSKDFGHFRRVPEYGSELKELCTADAPCSWGNAVNVDNKFVFVSQPEYNRVIIVEVTERFNPVEVSDLTAFCDY